MKQNSKNRNVIHYIQPRYYKNFTCIGPDCPMNCCFGWRIDWKKDEVEKLKSAECSDELKELVNKTFVKASEDSEDYIVDFKFGENNHCPLQDENGLCRIQKELGVDYMSETCMVYPRSTLTSRDFILYNCHLSCIHILDILMNDSHSMELERYTKNVNKKQELHFIDEIILKHPEIEYWRQIFELYYDIISNESHSLETSVNWGSYAAIRLTDVINKGHYDFIPEAIWHIREDVSDKELSDKLETIEPDYDVKLKFVVQLNNITFGSDIFSDIIIDENTVDAEKFKEGERRFNEFFADRPFVFKNIALGLLVNFRMPFRSFEVSIFDNYCYYIAAFVGIKLMGPAIFMKNTSVPELEYKKAISLFLKQFSHNIEIFTKIVDLLKQFRCDVPANLSAIIK